MVKHALVLGVNFFDTANCYSWGTSEEYLEQTDAWALLFPIAATYEMLYRLLPD